MEKRIITSADLFGKLQEIVILHADEEYRLRITGNNKLILTK
jgi:hemin uptake protein HemP